MAEEHARATDVLANERTFLAYVRTSLSLVAFGFVIARFALFTREISGLAHMATSGASVSGPLGTIVALLGVAIAIFGGYRYVAADRAIARGGPAALAPGQAIVTAGIVAAIGIAVAVVLTIVRSP